MSKSTVLWGAGLACALGGAVAGNALGSTPVLDRPTIGNFYQMHQTAGEQDTGREPLPDHYPLVTRSGTVPVAELGMRGLYSQARYRAYGYSDGYTSAELATADYQPPENSRPYHGRDDTGMGDPVPNTQAPLGAGAGPSESAGPLQLAAGPAALGAGGSAKLIDVKATLAMR